MGNRVLKNGKTTFNFLPTGDLYQVEHQGIQLNQVKGNVIDGSMNGIYLRILDDLTAIQAFPLIGGAAKGHMSVGENQLKWQGTILDIAYEVVFSLTDAGIWFWDILLSGSGHVVDVVYGQDIGLATPDTLLANEAYVSQYVDHRVLSDDLGVVVASRQNQVQNGQNPYLQQGSLTGAAHFSTDGFQFFGKSYKGTNVPAILAKEQLEDRVYQYEFAYVALQTNPIVLLQQQKVNFYGMILEDHPLKIETIENKALILEKYQEIQQTKGSFVPIEKATKNSQISGVLNGKELSNGQLDQLFPARKLEEFLAGQISSFFTESNEHVVLANKELEMERPNGHILMSGKSVDAKEETLTTTSYMYGVFQSQIVAGNTSMNRFISNTRNPLNTFKTSGQRIYLLVDGCYQLLAIPSAYEMGFNYARWHYQLVDDLITITVYTKTTQSEVALTVHSKQGKKYQVLVTQEIIVNDTATDNAPDIKVNATENQLIAKPNQATLAYQKYPNLTYRMEWESDGTAKWIASDFWFEEELAEVQIPVTSLLFEQVSELSITISASLEGELTAVSPESFNEATEAYRLYLADLHRHFNLTSETPNTEIERYNTIVWWYTHNMLIHYLVPHGLEQFGGAAWGTRDVCQGPIEFFMATQRFDVVREILTMIFAHQFVEDGNWPQWFMFDRYEEVMADESHGDIIVWPLKVIGDYLVATGDVSILEVEVPYMSRKDKKATSFKESVKEHIVKELAYITSHFLPGTYLSCYGDGDWDDTLQPYDSRLKEDMASTWTVALTYQALKTFATGIEKVNPEWSKELLELAQNVEKDYRKYMLQDQTLPGFVLKEGESFDYIVHPTDQKTQIDYRLLPMTRSMISELLTPTEMRHHMALIEDNLLFPDGVHLMSQPANYQGGVSQYFKRAEQAANFGREIGLQYVHAHIRYSEALAKVGEGQKMWQALSTINPILLTDYVANAEIRQSNAYFSSSDGKFDTRYEAATHFSELKTGDRLVKGGWRIYSSGPGIYLNQFFTHLIGIQVEKQALILDPMLPIELGEVKVDFAYLSMPLKVIYRWHEAEDSVVINQQSVPFKRTLNPYRTGGFKIEGNQMQEIVKNTTGPIQVIVSMKTR